MRLFIFCLFFFSFVSCHAQKTDNIVLAEKGNSNYIISISPNATAKVKEATNQLQKYFYQIGEVKIPIVDERKIIDSPQIIIGGGNLFQSLGIELPYNKIKKDGYIIRTEGRSLFISGVNEKGVINGVYAFLQKYLGCRYYAQDKKVIPHKDSIILHQIFDIQNPAFEIRILHSFEGNSEEYCKWNMLDIPPQQNGDWLKPWIHTTTKYFSLKWGVKKNPRYFTYVAQKPIDIDYTNKKVLQIMIEKIKSKLSKQPQAIYLGVSQADRTFKLTKKQEVLSTDITLRFANEIAREFPQKIITYLAYQYSRKPPKNIHPLSNILIIICNTTGNRNRAINPNDSFFQDLNGWEKLTNNIMVWDYVVNTKYPLAPYPNFNRVQEALKNYRRAGVTKIFLEGSNQPAAEFQQLRSYLLSKLLWNPSISVDSVIHEFLYSYYGAAAPFIREYINKINYKFSKVPLLRTANPSTYYKSIFSDTSLKEYEGLFDKAKDAVIGNKRVLDNVDRLQQSLRFVKLEIYRKRILNNDNRNLRTKQMVNGQSFSPGYRQLLEEFVQKAKKYNTRKITPRGKTPELYEKIK